MLTVRVLQAESDLSDKTKREELDAVIAQARVALLRDLGLRSEEHTSELQSLRESRMPSSA